MLMEKPVRNNMEKGFSDLGPKRCESPVADSEDSVDIYSGLDYSPENNDKSAVHTQNLSEKLKESMDLYEEIITEEQQERQSAENELKIKVNAAEMKVKELQWKLQQMQTQNKTLLTQNVQLKKNICAVIKTAKMEISRKDEEINRLMKRPGRFGCSPFPQSHKYSQRQSTGPNPAGANDPSVSTPENNADCAEKGCPQPSFKDRSGFGHCPEVTVTSPLTSLPSDKVRCISAEIKATAKHADSVLLSKNRDSKIPHPVNHHVPTDECTRSSDRLQNYPVTQDLKDRKHQPTEKREQHSREEHGASYECKVKDRAESNAEHKEIGRDYVKMSKNAHKHPTELPRRSDRVNSPPLQKRSSSLSDSLHHRSSGSSSLKGWHRDPKDTYTKRNREQRYSEDKNDIDRSVQESKSQEGRQPSSTQKSTSSRYRQERSPLRDHQRREERSSRRERDSRTETCKDYDRRRRKESYRSERDSHKRKHEDTKEMELKSNRQTAESTGTERNNAGNKNQIKCLMPVGQRHQSNGNNIVGLHEGAVEKVSEKTSQNKKLSFMETLNLTVSPVKMPRPCAEVRKPENRPQDRLLEFQDDCDQFALGADYCVLDELDSSHETLQKKLIESPVEKPFLHHSSEEIAPKIHTSDVKNCETDTQQDREKRPNQMLNQVLTLESERQNENVSKENGECGLPTILHKKELKSPALENITCPKDCHLTSKTEDDGAVTTTFLNECQHGDSQKCNDTPELQAEDHISMSDSKTGDSICQAPLTAQCAIMVTQGPSSICIDVQLSPDKKTCVRTTMQNSSCPVRPESQGVSTSVSMEKHPGCEVGLGKTFDISADTVSSTVGGLPETCNVAVTPEVTENMDISSTGSECTKKSVQDHIQAKEETVELPRTSRKVVVSVEEASSSVLSPKNCPRPDSTGNSEQSPLSSHCVPLLHDEDSMMLTLKSIRNIPSAISPLTSPVRPVKSQPFTSEKAPHVKSLNKEFSNVTGTLSTSTRRMNVNKENQKPGCSPSQAQETVQTPPTTTSASSSSSSEDESELEEGEIMSDSEDDSLAPASPKESKASSVMMRNNWSSPRYPKLAEKQGQKPKCPAVPQGKSGVGSKTVTSKSDDSSVLAKRRFKTIVPLLPKTNPSTIPEVMDMLKLIRALMRKKYMKLHKTFPKKSFYNIIDMAHFSFTEFVNNVTFCKLCSLEDHLKSKLKDVISLFMSKISNNGIVKRIFEQQAPSLKKKLWTFVEGQFDFLFKEIKCTLVSVCRPTDDRPLSGNESKVEKSRVRKELPDTTTKSSVASELRPNGKLGSTKSSVVPVTRVSSIVTPYRTGLGSRGKNLRLAVDDDEDKIVEVTERKNQDMSLVHDSSVVVLSNSTSSPEKPAACVRLSHNSSLQDKSDFEILTEQQTSSLTFNLVTDSQMGEIFKCLLQGSDLLENSVSGGEASHWPTGTPRKDIICGESFGALSPNKPITPSKLLTWSPCKISPNSKLQMPLNPAVLDESCMLEVPSSLPYTRVPSSSTGISQRSYSILAEDLAVSLTIPSPLKSDSHLSFLHSGNGEPSSAPDSVISAHFSEDALLDGEDATEQDIHLALDSDNTSSESSGGGPWVEASKLPVFQLKPHVPMQAVVMEKSNDHFIVRIRHASTSIASSISYCLADENKGQPLPAGYMGQIDATAPATDVASVDRQSSVHKDFNDVQPCDEVTTCITNSVLLPGEVVTEVQSCETGECLDIRNDSDVKIDDTSLHRSESYSGSVAKKRKKHHVQPKAKKAKSDVSQEATGKRRQKKCRSVEKWKSPKSKKGTSVSPPVSPNSLSAKNVVRKKGEVVATWTREEDREILMNLKMKGASADTFSALSTKMNKSPSQIAERFSQLMKLFRKKEKMNT